ncbi:MAG: tripartite tricarboxylate transporter permease [Betaproteobacteria bacterium]|nr:tripartite tricarboxylate transporter permease [Betaproteobacteria bacterium]
MELAQGLALGFAVATTPTNIFFAFVGALVGTFVGIMPGLGASASIAILLPLTFGMEPATAIIMLAGVFSGSKYGGAVTSILMNLPGEGSSVVTCFDGYQLALQGRGGPALGMAAISGFVAGTVGVVGLNLLGPLLASLAMGLGPPEYFALTLLGLSLVTSLTGKSLVKGLLATAFGLILATVGADIMTSATRLTFGRLELLDGIDFVTVSVGLFALGEILLNVEKQIKFSLIEVPKKLALLLPSASDFVQCTGTWVRSTIIGFLIGALPGTGAAVASFLSYTVAKNISRTPERFGKGAMEGVAAAESADNAAVAGSMAPMLTLGIPGSSATAMMMGALVMAGVRPGPMMLTEHPEVFWGVVASLYIGNVMLLIINVPMIPLLVNVLRVPYYILYIIIIAIAAVGVYSVDNSIFDLWMMGIFGVLGYIFKKLDYPLAPIVLALILGPLVERALLQTLVISRGSFAIFLTRPAAAAFLALALLALFAPWLQQLWIRRFHRAVSLAPGDR